MGDFQPLNNFEDGINEIEENITEMKTTINKLIQQKGDNKKYFWKLSQI